MKLVVYLKNGTPTPHHKNWDAIQRMCKSCNVEFEVTHSLERIQVSDYDLLYTMVDYIDPSIIPNNVKAIYGPQFGAFPEGSMVGKFREELVGRCVYNGLSKWVTDMYADLTRSNLIMPLANLPFAVDTEKFAPLDAAQEKIYDCCLYIKHRSQALINAVTELLNKKGLNYKKFVYGSYNESDYIASLQKSKFMIVLDAHESQGFALEEAMSINVPLIVIDAQSMYDETCDGFHFIYEQMRPAKLLATSVPYWSDDCGIKLLNEHELEHAIDLMMRDYASFHPRNYVFETLSDKVCMKRIIDYFKIENQ